MDPLLKLKHKFNGLKNKFLPSNPELYHPLFDQHQFIFIHIPKTGGLSILNSLFNDDIRVGHKTALQYFRNDEQRFSDYFKFAFVRNPYDRLFSAYNFLKRGGLRKVDHEFAKEHIFQFQDFQSFVYFLSDGEKAQHILNWKHFKPQYQFVCDLDHNVMVDFIGKYESISKDYEYLRQKFGLGEGLKHVNPSAKSSYRYYYNQEMMEIVKGLYPLDFELFDYSLV